MSADLFLDLAEKGHCVPIGPHLVLQEREDPKAIALDGARLGEVIAETAARFDTPLAIPLMDLAIEKEAMLGAMGVSPEQIETFHFDEAPSQEVGEMREVPATPRMTATCKAIERVASESSLFPMGMCIGPFSLMTKLVAEPITPVYMAASGATADEDEDVELLDACIELGTEFILRYIEDQIDAGAKAVIVCEPAANQVYLSPNQLSHSYAVFDRYVMRGLERIKSLMDRRGVDFILHDCGELTDGMVSRFGKLEPVMLSLGCSRNLAADAALLPKRTVLYGNLPSKRFWSAELTPRFVEDSARELRREMAAARHPFILGSECDILSVPGSEAEIASKVDALMRAARS